METINEVVLYLLTEKRLPIEFLIPIPVFIGCCIISTLVYYGVIKQNSLKENQKRELAATKLIMCFFIAGTFSFCMARIVDPVLNALSYLVCPIIMGMSFEEVSHLSFIGIVKLLTNIWVSITRREKVTSEDLTHREEGSGSHVEQDKRDSR